MPNNGQHNTDGPRVAANISLLADYVTLTAPVISASAASSSSITISLTTPSPGVDYYRLEGGTDSNSLSVIESSLGDGDFDYPDAGLTASTLYYYRLVAVGIDGSEAASAVVSDTTSAAAATELPSELSGLSTQSLVEDGFESGDHSSPGYPDFDWRVGGGDSGSIVTMIDGTATVIRTSSGNPASTEVPGEDWTAYEGDNSLRISYTSGLDSYQDPEQYWGLDSSHLGVDEVIETFALRVPFNFKHGDNTSVPNNYKLNVIYMDGYEGSGSGATVMWEYWHDDANPGSSRVAYHWAEGDFTGANGHRGHTDFISYPSDQGRWMHLVFRVKKSSARGVADGEIQMWRRWDDESTWVKIHEKLDAILNPPDPNESAITGWHGGYMLGALNGIETDDGERANFLIDNYKLMEVV